MNRIRTPITAPAALMVVAAMLSAAVFAIATGQFGGAGLQPGACRDQRDRVPEAAAICRCRSTWSKSSRSRRPVAGQSVRTADRGAGRQCADTPELCPGPADLGARFGARSSFGVRGVRLYADDIPGTMPDGQGQFSNFDLDSADRIEVLRGPFSALYGNSSGGVISIFTEDAPAGQRVDASGEYGSFNTSAMHQGTARPAWRCQPGGGCLAFHHRRLS